MEKLVYALPRSFVVAHPKLIAALLAKKKAILEQLPKKAWQNVSRHHALGQLSMEQLPELGQTLVSDKAHNALLSAVGLDIKYATVAELLSCISEISVLEQELVD